MSIYKGSQEIYHIYRGAQRISVLYKGAILVYPKGRWIGWGIPASRGTFYIAYQSETTTANLGSVYFNNSTNDPYGPKLTNDDAKQYEGSATVFYMTDPNGVGCFRISAGTTLSSITVHVSCEVLSLNSANPGQVVLWHSYTYGTSPALTHNVKGINTTVPVGSWTPVHYSFTIDRSSYINYDLTIYPVTFEKHVHRTDQMCMRSIAMWA